MFSPPRFRDRRAMWRPIAPSSASNRRRNRHPKAARSNPAPGWTIRTFPRPMRRHPNCQRPRTKSGTNAPVTPGDRVNARALVSRPQEHSMTFASMTGFAESAGSHEGVRWRWEAKSVNGRSLDMRLRTPPGYDGLEPPARRLAGERFLRGAFQISLTIEEQDAARGLRVDAAALASAVKIAREVAAETGLAPARIDGLLALKGVIVQEEVLPVEAPERGVRDAGILDTLATALDALGRARANEGHKLLAVLN